MVCWMDVNVAAVVQAVQVAADRAFGYVQSITNFSLWNNYLAVTVRKIVEDKVQKFTGYIRINIAAQLVFIQFVRNNLSLQIIKRTVVRPLCKVVLFHILICYNGCCIERVHSVGVLL